MTGNCLLIAVAMATTLLLSMTSSCSIEHRVRPEVQQVDHVIGSGTMNMTLLMTETARLSLADVRGRLVFKRFFPMSENLSTDLDTLRVTTSEGHSLPWIQVPAATDGMVAVSFVISATDDVTVQFEWRASVVCEHSSTGDCQRVFNGAVYPIVGNECAMHDGSFTFDFPRAAKSDSKLASECLTTMTSSVPHFNHTFYGIPSGADPFAHAQNHDDSDHPVSPFLYQITLKCYGGVTCTCSCQPGRPVSEFCQKYLTEHRLLTLYPPSWGDELFVSFVMVPFFLAVMIQIINESGLISDETLGRLKIILPIAFRICLGSSISMLLFCACVIPIHMDATNRACTAVYESDGAYFFPLLFWTYFPYVLTLLIVTGFLDNTDLIVAWNGRLTLFFVLYQLLSPLAQTWFFLYNYVIPLTDALLLSVAVLVIFSVRLYLRNPLKTVPTVTAADYQ